jgi:hypothetical protein
VDNLWITAFDANDSQLVWITGPILAVFVHFGPYPVDNWILMQMILNWCG